MNINATDLNLLKVFEALHDEGSASRAALQLGLTQSAVSAALNRLRAMYGDQLFVRTGRGLSPTLIANQLKPVISDALNKCRQSFSLVQPSLASYEGRSVTIGLSDDFEIALGRQLIESVAQQAKNLRLIFRQTHSQIAVDALMARQFDLTITAGGIPNRLLGRHLLGEGGYACLVDRASLGDRSALDLEDYVTREHILISSGGFIGIVDEVLAARGLSRKVVTATTHFAALPFLLKGSAAVATLPTHAARAIARLCDIQMLPCPIDLPHYPIELGWRTHAQTDGAMLLVKQAIIDSFAL
ncbi:LysR family transcriptional regulator [Pseudomonas sp. MWU13-2105]|uniref:LysR family transcriptional regulator n=1 Tax=Pseudomonas sp. MWU13-2105 TaxID=2935074 RepID=UPI00200D9BC0|nr:LysR family transcriptional regulator [Pseudomonas sp. MWU13-2105]